MGEERWILVCSQELYLDFSKLQLGTWGGRRKRDCPADWIFHGLRRFRTRCPPTLGTHQPSQQSVDGGRPPCVCRSTHGRLHAGIATCLASHWSAKERGTTNGVALWEGNQAGLGVGRGQWRPTWALVCGMYWGGISTHRRAPHPSSLTLFPIFSSSLSGPTLLLNSDIIRARLGASALDRYAVWGYRARGKKGSARHGA